MSNLSVCAQYQHILMKSEGIESKGADNSRSPVRVHDALFKLNRLQTRSSISLFVVETLCSLSAWHVQCQHISMRSEGPPNRDVQSSKYGSIPARSLCTTMALDHTLHRQAVLAPPLASCLHCVCRCGTLFVLNCHGASIHRPWLLHRGIVALVTLCVSW